MIGAGTIGPDIGYYFKGALPSLELVLVDVAEAALTKAQARFAAYIEKGIARGKLTDEQRAGLESGITYTTDYDALSGADWVLEAATEDLALKRRIFAQAEAVVAREALLTSNTARFPRNAFQRAARPERATVTHSLPAHGTRSSMIDWPRWIAVCRVRALDLCAHRQRCRS